MENETPQRPRSGSLPDLGIPLRRWRKAITLVKWSRSFVPEAEQARQAAGSSDSGGPAAPLLNQKTGDADSVQLTPSGQVAAVRDIIFYQSVSPLLTSLPFGLLAPSLGFSPLWTFWLNLLPIIALAQILGDATEELAMSLHNDTVGGLLNATFGNAIEMILTVQALRKGMVALVRAQLLGSVLSNLLLVMGTAFFLGGLWGGPVGKVQSFNKQAASANVTMLFLSTASLAMPTVFYHMPAVMHHTPHDPDDETLALSRYASIYILLSYVAFLVYQLYTHISLFEAKAAEAEQEEDEARLGPVVALCLLLGTTVLVAASSEVLIGSVDGFVEAWGIGEAFVGMIILPLAGNACEHLGAIRMAIQEKMDIAIGIAIGSATQIALFAVPSAVIVGWMLSQPMDLNFDPLNALVMASSTIVVASVVQDGFSTWVEGFMLIMTYAIIATMYWFLPTEEGGWEPAT